MDDFGRSLERDYGLGRASKGRIGTRNKSSSKSLYRQFESSSRFSGSFNGRSGHQEPPSSSFREGKTSSPRSWSNNSRLSSYSVYDEVFSSNTQSTIPVFEDVFRVHSSRMKVSELRENDLFRGVVDFRRTGNRSRLTYEDIFGESPEEFSNPFNVAGSKPSSSGRQSPAQAEKKKDRTVEISTKTRSRSATPRKGSSGEISRSHAETIAQRPVEVEARNGDHHAPPKIQGSFLGMSQSQSFRREETSESPRKQDEPAANGDQSHEHESPGTSSPDGVQRAWLSIGEVSLVTKPSENPPPVRSAPGRSSSSKNSLDGAAPERTLPDSGPPPARVPPPIIDNSEQSQAHAPAPPPSGSSELLEKVLRERSAHSELSIREKVLDWQKHNLSQQAAEEERQRESFRRRSETLDRLRSEREEMERVAAEVEATAAEQARVRAERAAAEELERDARKKQQEQQEQQEPQQEEEATRHVSDEKPVEDHHAGGAGQTSLIDPPTSTNGASGAPPAAVNIEGLSDAEKSNRGEVEEEEEEGGGKADTGEDDNMPAAAATTSRVETEEVVQNSDNETSIGIDTISSSSASASENENGSSPVPVKEEPAPETPERLEEELHARHEKSSKSSEVELLGEEPEEKQKPPGRSLVARINAEVKERAVVSSEERRTRPRLKRGEAVAKEREDQSGRSGGGGGGGRVSLREQLEKERVARLERSRNGAQPESGEAGISAEARLRAERTLVERITAEVRERAAANARAEQEKAEREAAEQRERVRLQRLNRARERERERLEKLEREREKEQERLLRELEREREIEREKDRVGLEEKAAKERAEAEAEAARIKMERAVVERATAEARARAERAAYERVASANGFSEPSSSSRPASVPKQRFNSSTSMPTGGSAMENGIRRTTSSTSLESDRYSASSSNTREFQQEFQEIKGETPERRKARLERYQRTLNRAAQALAQKNKRDLELQSEQAERQRLAERLDTDIKRWSVGKDGNIRALLSTLQYVLWPESGWKQVSLTELISPGAVKKAYRRATLCVHPDKMQQKHASVQHKYIAEKVFHILQVAWNKFNSQEAL